MMNVQTYLIFALVALASVSSGCARARYSFSGTFALDVPGLDNLPRLHRKMWELSNDLQVLGLAQLKMKDEMYHFAGEFAGTYKGVPGVNLHLTCRQHWADPGPEFVVVVSAPLNSDRTTAAKCQEILDIVQERMTIAWEPTTGSNATSEPAPSAASEAVHP